MVDIVIVNWNAGAYLLACLETIVKYGSGLVDRIIVVDNGSTDGSDAVAEALPNIVLVRAGTNLGFSRGSNLGAAQGHSPFILFLNPDAALYPDTLSKALHYIQQPKNSRVGICGVQLVDKSGLVARTCSRFPSIVGLLAHAAGIDRIHATLGHVMAEWDHGQTQQVDHVMGAFFLVRRELFETLGGFDERFFVYLEDLDFSLRARQSGWSTIYLTDAQAFHAGGGTSGQIKARRLFYSLRSRVLYAFKHFNLAGAMAVRSATILVEPFSRSVYALARGSPIGLTHIWRAYALLWQWLPQWALQRQKR